jgi:hypothetical protein
MLLIPESTSRTATVAVVANTDHFVTIRFPEKRDDFREIVKTRLFRWYGDRWQRAIHPIMNGSARDRAIEIACRLLAARFRVEVSDDLHPAILAGAYDPEQTRWITAYSGDHYHSWFTVSWRRPDDLYRAAMRISGARYAAGGVAVPPDQFEEVLDFAERYDFRLTSAAEALIAEQRQRLAGAVRVTVAAFQDPSPVTAGRKPGRLAVPDLVEVDHDLRD